MPQVYTKNQESVSCFRHLINQFDFLYQVDEYICCVISHTMVKLLRNMYIYKRCSLSAGGWECKSRVCRDNVSLTGLVEVSLLASAGTVVTSSHSQEASSYNMGSDGRDLGNIKRVF